MRVGRQPYVFPGATAVSTLVWQPVGPFQVKTSAWGLVTGRIISLAADPSDPSGNSVFVGTAGGGIWKSTNAAADPASVSFSPLTDTSGAFSSVAISSLSIGAVSAQPGGTGVVLGGTGDPNNALDSWYGVGILRSTDDGNTWSLIPQAISPVNSANTYDFTGNAFAGFAWSSVDPGLVVAAVADSEYGDLLGSPDSQAIRGLYYSSDAGKSWQLATIQDGSTIIQAAGRNVVGGNDATSVVWNPIRKRFYAAIRYHGYYESSDGITWARLAGQPGAGLSPSACPADPGLPGSPACPIFRGVLAVQPVTGDMFALTVDQNNIDQGLWRDACNLAAGACASPVQFADPIADQPLESAPGDKTIPNAAYDLVLAAVPSQQDTLLFAGATDIWRCSLANSCVWRNTTNSRTCDSAQVAPAQHAIESTFGASGLLYFGNDGGLWRTTDAVAQQQSPCSPDDAAHYQNLNSAIGSLAQVEAFSQDPADSSTLLAALGALGTAAPAAASGPWNQVLDGEGDAVAIDPSDPSNWYATSEFGVGINRCTVGKSCDIAAFGNVAIGEPQVDNDVQLIPAPWILDPLDPSRIILGTCRIWRGSADGQNWNQNSLLSGILDGQSASSCNGNAEIRALAVAPVSGLSPSSERIYAGMAGSLDGGGLLPGHIFTAVVDDSSQSSTTTWTDLYSSPVSNASLQPQFDPGGFDISSIDIDPHDPTAQTIYVTVQGYSTPEQPEPILYRSTDGGAHWLDITANLPPVPASSVVVDPNDANIVYVALDTGVYYTLNVASCSSPGAVCWNVLGDGLPNAPVTALMAVANGSDRLLRAATWGRGIWQTQLLTSSMQFTTATLSPAALTFPDQAAQTASTPQTVTLSNTGTHPLTVTSVSIQGDFNETDNCASVSLGNGKACSFQVVFDPSAAGPRQGSLTIYANVSGGQLVLPLSGTGLPPGKVVLTPSSLAFAATTVNSTSAPQSITVANTGSSSVTLSGESISGDFAIDASTCQSTLPPQTACDLRIVFKPATSGLRAGELIVTSSSGKFTAALSGTGQTAPTDALSPASLTFAPQQVGTSSPAQLITLSNTGDAPLTSIAATATGDFHAVNNCGSLLQGHATCTIAVSYVPAATGQESGTLTVSDVLRSQTIALSGTGIAPPGISATPKSLDFGNLAVGSTSSAQTVTLTNNGGFVLTTLAATVTKGFAIASSTCPATLPIGSTCAIGITFSPTVPGPVTGSLAVSAANLPQPLAVALAGAGADFSIAVAGSSSAVITSGQSAVFTLQLAALDNTSGTVSLACTGAPKNSTCTLNPSSIAVSAANTSSVTVTVATSVPPTSSALRPPAPWKIALPSLAMIFPLGWAGLRRRKRGLVALLALVALLVVPSGCGVTASSGASSGGGSGAQNSTPPGDYVITVTGTMANIVHSVAVKLTVQ